MIIQIQHLLPQIIEKPDKIIMSDQCRVLIKCSCGKIMNISIRNLHRKWSDQPYKCKSCDVKTYRNTEEYNQKWSKSFIVGLTPKRREQLSNNAKKGWTEERRMEASELLKYRNKHDQSIITGHIKGHEGWKKRYGEEKYHEMAKLGHNKLREMLKTDKGLVEKYHNNFKLSDPQVREKHRKSTSIETKRRWADQEYREKMNVIYSTEEHKKKLSDKSKRQWTDPEYRKKMQKIYDDPEYKKKLSIISKEINSRPNVRLAKARALANQPSISSQEDTLAAILTDLTVDFQRQIMIGFYSFDFLIKRKTGKDMLIEVNGVWHHMKPETQAKDAAKATFIKEYHSDKYELRTIWGYEFGSPERIREIILSILENKPNEQINFNFNDVKMIIPEKSDDVRIMLSKYHYIGRIGRYGLIIEYKLNDVLIGCITFSTINRAESAHRLGLTTKEVYELTRLCIHPNYHKKNFASWMISRAVKMLWEKKEKAKCIISFADPLFGHEGKVYKASGWISDDMTSPSYFYRDNDGYIMHKKTLYNQAQKAHLAESEFATEYNYAKVETPPKYRYIKYK